MNKQIDGCYTRMLRMALNTMEAETRQQGIVPRAGHCVCHKEEIVSNLDLWEPTDAHTDRGRRRNIVDNLIEDTGVNSTSVVRTLMDGEQWRTHVKTDG